MSIIIESENMCFNVITANTGFGGFGANQAANTTGLFGAQKPATGFGAPTTATAGFGGLNTFTPAAGAGFGGFGQKPATGFGLGNTTSTANTGFSGFGQSAGKYEIQSNAEPILK